MIEPDSTAQPDLPSGVSAPGYTTIFSYAVVPAGLLTFLLWDQIARPLVAAWCLLVFILFGVLLRITYRQYSDSVTNNDSAPNRANRVLLLTTFGCLVWGSAGVLFFTPDLLSMQLVLAVFLWGFGLFLVTPITTNRTAFSIAVALVILPLAIRLIVQGQSTQLILGVSGIVYGMLLLRLQQVLNSSLQVLSSRYTQLTAALDETRIGKEAAEQAVIDKSRFCEAASHDLSQPLHAQGLFVGELRERIKDPECSVVLEKLQSSMDALNGLFNSLLDVSKLDAGDIIPEITNFGAHKLLRELADEFTSLANKKDINLSIVDSSTVIHSDPDLLGSVLRNFVSNAVRYTNSGRIVVGCRRLSNHVRLEVWDSGIGIPEDSLQDIFIPFHQLGNPERNRNKGVGLGLAVVERVAKLLDLQIDVSSAQGKGSMFSVTVPTGSALPESFAESIPAVTEQRNLTGLSVVVIDDESAVQEGMYGLFQAWGCNVLSAPSAEKAVQQLTSWEFKPEAVIADFHLAEGESGIGAIKALRTALGMDVPGILISGDTTAETMCKAQESGCQLLHKPVHPRRLHHLICHALQHEYAN